jgi:DNA-binding NtrC family response regulator
VTPTSNIDRAVSASLQRELDLICRAGAGPCVLITVCASGDDEPLAHRIHVLRHAPRGPFLMIDCGLPVPALDEDLFGRLECRPAARRCTLLLKEVGRLTADQQLRLLMALRQNATCGPEPPRVRVVASTSEGLFERVVGGSFDADLFYSLNTIHLDLRRH